MSRNNDPETPPGSDRQWWLTEGPESCFLCETSTHPEALAYCMACDRGLCFFCLYESSRAAQGLCPQCAYEQQETT